MFQKNRNIFGIAVFLLSLLTHYYSNYDQEANRRQD